jgi:clan AA aspartic protease (TIGR02281 family)
MTRVILLALLLAGMTVQAESVALIREHGTFVVPVLINDKITLKFTVDSGAADVSIPADVFSTLVRAETIEETDMLDSQTYVLADGSKQRAHRFRIRTLRVGSLELRNVVASVAPTSGTLLLGQSFLERLSFWSFDNQQHLLVMNVAPSYAGAPSVMTQPPRDQTESTAATPYKAHKNYEYACGLAQTMCSDPELSAGCNDSRNELAAANYYCTGVTAGNNTKSTVQELRQSAANSHKNYEYACGLAQTMCGDPDLSAGCNDSRSELAAANYYCRGVTTH